MSRPKSFSIWVTTPWLGQNKGEKGTVKHKGLLLLHLCRPSHIPHRMTALGELCALAALQPNDCPLEPLNSVLFPRTDPRHVRVAVDLGLGGLSPATGQG